MVIKYHNDIAKNARKELESKTGNSVLTGENFLAPAKNTKIINQE